MTPSQPSSPSTATRLLTAAALAGASIAAAAPALTAEVQSHDMIWNGVVVDRDRIIVSGPRWSGSKGPAVAEVLASQELRPFPDAAWNDWKPGNDAANQFVNVNAIHDDGLGGLWVVDTGSPEFGGDPLPGGAKAVRIDMAKGAVDKVYRFGPQVARPKSYVDDIRINGRHAYLTDAGNPGIIVLDLDTGAARRVLDGHPSTKARPDRPVVVDGQVLKGPDGQPLQVHADPFELSPDGHWILYAPLGGPWFKVPTRVLDDASVSPAELAASVRPWADLPPMGGEAMARDGSLYFSDLKANAIRKRDPDGSIVDIISDPRLHWVDAMYIDSSGNLWLPAAQLDRAALFHGGKSQIQWPVELFKLSLGEQRADAPGTASRHGKAGFQPLRKNPLR